MFLNHKQRQQEINRSICNAKYILYCMQSYTHSFYNTWQFHWSPMPSNNKQNILIAYWSYMYPNTHTTLIRMHFLKWSRFHLALTWTVLRKKSEGDKMDNTRKRRHFTQIHFDYAIDWACNHYFDQIHKISMVYPNSLSKIIFLETVFSISSNILNLFCVYCYSLISIIPVDLSEYTIRAEER